MHPRPRGAVGPPLARMLQALAVKEIVYPVEARCIDADVAHVVDQSHAHLVRWVRGCATVVTCHDLWGLGFGGGFRRAGYRRRVSALRAATRVICVSQSAKQEAVALGVEPWRIRVVRNRVEPFFAEPPSTAEIQVVVDRLGVIERGFVLHVGNNLPYKNIEGLLAALVEVQRVDRRCGLLLKVGAPLSARQQALASRLGVEARSIGEVTPADLRALYHLASCLAYPSLHEGFGWPVAEALACGCPVVASRTGALPEIAGDAAVLVDATKPEEIADAILRVIGGESLRDDLARRGRERGRELAEGDVGAEVLAVYQEAAAERR